MKKRTFAVWAGGGFATGLLGACLLATWLAGQALGRYPDAQAVHGVEVFSVADDNRAVDRQGDYYTPDGLPAVRAWYARRLQVSPAANLYASGDCAWLNQARNGLGLKYEATVLLCTEARGTRIAVRERVGLWP
jgi:hypothetical protein